MHKTCNRQPATGGPRLFACAQSETCQLSRRELAKKSTGCFNKTCTYSSNFSCVLKPCGCSNKRNRKRCLPEPKRGLITSRSRDTYQCSEKEEETRTMFGLHQPMTLVCQLQASAACSNRVITQKPYTTNLSLKRGPQLAGASGSTNASAYSLRRPPAERIGNQSGVRFHTRIMYSRRLSNFFRLHFLNLVTDGVLNFQTRRKFDHKCKQGSPTCKHIRHNEVSSHWIRSGLNSCCFTDSMLFPGSIMMQGHT